MMAAGQHELELVNDTLGYRATRTDPGAARARSRRSSLELPQGVLNVNASPWAEVWIDGRRVGETPIGNLPMSIGPHEVVFRHPAARREAPGRIRHAQGASAAQRRHEIERGNTMASPARRLIAPFLLAASFAHTALGQVPGRDVVGPARDLYASARYDEALAVLNDLQPADTGTTVADRKSIEQYRSLCLLALGRGTEAESAIAAVVTADPVVPARRGRSVAAGARRRSPTCASRLLPDIANSRYGEAKALFDRKDYAAAAQQLPPGDFAARRSGHGRQAVRPAHAGERLPRPVGRGDRAAARAAQARRRRAARPAAGAACPIRTASTRCRTRTCVPPIVIRQTMPQLTPAMKLAGEGARRRRRS